jgi:AcrR family transcriptional regulator
VGRPPGKTKADNDTRAGVVAVAGRLLGERGYEGMSLADVAAAAGLTKAALYHYFPRGKNELVLAVAEEVLARDGAELAATLAGASGVREKLEAVAGWALARDHHPARMLRDARRSLSPAESGAMFGRFMETHHAPLEGVLRAGVASGELRPHDTEFAAWAFLSLLAEFGADAADFPAPDLARRIVGLLLDGLLPREDSGGSSSSRENGKDTEHGG